VGIYVGRPGHGLPLGLTLLFACGSLCLLLALLGLLLARPRAAVIFLLLGFAAAGGAAAQLFDQRFPPNHVSHLGAMRVDLNDAVRLQGRILSNPVRTADGLQFDLETERVESRGQVHTVTGKVRLRLQVGEDAESAAIADSLRLRTGDRISVLAPLRRPRIRRRSLLRREHQKPAPDREAARADFSPAQDPSARHQDQTTRTNRSALSSLVG
jgi:hypothetical protein